MTKLEFARRAKIDRNDAATRKLYRSICGGYRIVYSVPAVRGLPAQWRAEINTPDGWAILSRHRTRDGAERSCQAAAMRETTHA